MIDQVDKNHNSGGNLTKPASCPNWHIILVPADVGLDETTVCVVLSFILIILFFILQTRKQPCYQTDESQAIGVKGQGQVQQVGVAGHVGGVAMERAGTGTVAPTHGLSHSVDTSLKEPELSSLATGGRCTIHCFVQYRERERERNVLFNDALNTFYLRLYGIRHMVKDHSDSEKGNPLPPHRLLID